MDSGLRHLLYYIQLPTLCFQELFLLYVRRICDQFVLFCAEASYSAKYVMLCVLGNWVEGIHVARNVSVRNPKFGFGITLRKIGAEQSF